VWNSKRLVLAHLWFAFAGFGAALPLGEWQMFIRSPLHTWISNPEWYYRSVTAHGTTMAYVFPTLVAMGFGFREHSQLNATNARLNAYVGSETVQQQFQRARDLEQREEEAEAPAKPEIGAAGPIPKREPAHGADDDGIRA